MILTFLKPGMLTLIQDLGRPGHQSSGVPPSGALDRTSAAAANWCVGNPETAPVFEITMTGPLIRFDEDCQIAITGADMSPVIHDEPVRRYETIDVRSGSILAFGKLMSGCRAYLAIRGRWHITYWLGSASALSVGDIDLLPQSLIKKGMTLMITTDSPLPSVRRHPQPVPAWPSALDIRVLPGPEFSSFSADHIAAFFSTTFTIGVASNRIGYRLEPLFKDFHYTTEMISSGIVPGTIQITREGQPIILLADAQTVGGYPRIGNITASDLDALGQLRIGDTVRFHPAPEGEGSLIHPELG